MIIQLLLIIFICYVVSRTILRFKKGDISSQELFIWLLFWGIVAGASLFPQKTDVVAQFLGVSRGADLLVYLSIIVLFFIVFKIIVKLEKIDHDITRLVRNQALDKVKERDNQ